jgi:hypothetical protein
MFLCANWDIFTDKMGEIINSLWIGRPLSLIERLSIISFLRNGHEYHLYCYDKIGGVPKGVIVRDAAEILPASEIFYYEHRAGKGKGSVAAFANLFRYKLLLERGGWWMDTDMVCLRPLDFIEPVVFAGQRTSGGLQVTNAAIKLPKRHLIAEQCYETARRESGPKMSWGKTGPHLLDDVVKKNSLQQSIKAPEIFCPLDYSVWQKLLEATPLAQLITPESRTIHLWHELWRRAKIKTDSEGHLMKPLTPAQRILQFFKHESAARCEAASFNELVQRYDVKA